MRTNDFLAGSAIWLRAEKRWIKVPIQHYGPIDLSARILERLQKAGKDPAKLSRDDIAAFDEFHTGGREATRELAQFAALRSGTKVLDIGSGVGGPARTLAAEVGCQVTGIDITAEYCQVAEMLTERGGSER